MSKKQKAPPVVEADEMPLTEDVTPKCSECLKVLDWRDAAYVLGSSLCKRCHQRDQRKRLQGEFHPAVQLVQRGKKLVEVAVLKNRAARRQTGMRNPPRPLNVTWLPQVKRGMKTLKELRRVAA